MYKDIQVQAGFIHFAEFQFDEARDLFRGGGLDIREVGSRKNMIISNASLPV